MIRVCSIQYRNRQVKVHEKNYPSSDLDLGVVLFSLKILDELVVWCSC